MKKKLLILLLLSSAKSMYSMEELLKEEPTPKILAGIMSEGNDAKTLYYLKAVGEKEKQKALSELLNTCAEGSNQSLPLGLAIDEGNWGLVEKLVELGADLSKKDDFGVFNDKVKTANKKCFNKLKVLQVLAQIKPEILKALSGMTLMEIAKILKTYIDDETLTLDAIIEAIDEFCEAKEAESKVAGNLVAASEALVSGEEYQEKDTKELQQARKKRKTQLSNKDTSYKVNRLLLIPAFLSGVIITYFIMNDSGE